MAKRHYATGRERKETPIPSPMSDVRQGSVLAVAMSDCHFTLKPPIARSCEEDWLGVQASYLYQVGSLCSHYQAPLIITGDLFDKPDPPSELLVWLMKHLPYPCYGVPGQHDLYYHRFDSWQRTGFGVMVQAGRITLLKPGEPLGLAHMVLYGFPWGCEVTPLKRERHLLEDRVRVAVVHQYIWWKDYKHPNVSDDGFLPYMKERLSGYDSAVFGDNHKGFGFKLKEYAEGWPKSILNCGTFMRRKQDERDYRPCVGLLLKDGSIRRYYLDVSGDKFIDHVPTKGKTELDATELMEELASLGDSALDFADALRRAVGEDNISEGARELILRILEAGR